ncbi:helicase-associated domain-containing protein [Psychromicrobium lacuslunae]|uniref:helicase-associated domain-containing protein n=1 Tax=Psychromicrobium lacuslunae TaxID=1618207 RepID=UPI0005D3DDD6|nr:helicase-associated domain-containing protein [Psychromicrobium lacuslunae]
MSSIRALSEELAGRSDAALRELFLARPDLVQPSVPDFAALAARGCARISVQRALDGLTKPQLQALEALLVAADQLSGGSIDSQQLSGLIEGSSKSGVQKILRELNNLALIYRLGAGFLPVSSLYQVIGAHPAGLGRSYQELARVATDWFERAARRLAPAELEPPTRKTPAEILAARFDQPHWWPELLSRAPEHTTAVLAKFDQGPLGIMPKNPGGSSANAALEFLLAEGILVALDAEHVELPREAGIAQRGGHILTGFSLRAESAPQRAVSASRRDNAALGAIAELLREVTALQEAISAQPLATLRSGGIGIRALRPLGQSLNIELSRVSLLVELAAAAGLIFLDADTSTWLVAADRWPAQRAQQWLLLSAAWWRLDRAPGLIGQPMPGGQGTINTLAAEARRADAPRLRSLLLHTLQTLTETADQQPSTVDAALLFAQARWQRPRLWRRTGKLAAGMMAEAELLGLLGDGALTDFGRLFIDDQPAAAMQALEAELPAAVTNILLQADLTGIAPGYLDPALSTELSLIAEREGHGPATTYRFSAASLRRAFDAGRSPQAVIDFLSAHSSTAIPQPLEYLINDTAQRHGTLQIDAAASMLRSSDDLLIATLLHEPSLANLRFSQLAPGIVSSSASPLELANALKSLGHSPALGELAAGNPTTRRRSPTPMIELDGRERAAETETDFDAQLAVLRSKPSGVPNNSAVGSQLSIETLREAIRTHRSVELTVVDGTGNPERLELVPLSVNNGRVRVFDARHDSERVISIHRIVDVDLIPKPTSRERT